MQPALLPAPQVITDAAGLLLLLQAVRAQPAIAVDTESNSLHAYRERVCLLQFSTPAQDFILDPLALPQLDELGAVFADARVQKVFHAAEYDLICLQRDFGWRICNVFDTMLAARSLGWPELGLAALLTKRHNIPVNKRFQRADWRVRPLPAEQLAYAQLDTHFLLALSVDLQAELARQALLPEASEEFERLLRSTARAAQRAPQNGAPRGSFWQVVGARLLAPRAAAILQAVYGYREDAARKADQPPFKILSDQLLLALAQQAPRNPGQLRSVGLAGSQQQQHGRQLLEAIELGRSAKPPELPAQPRTDPRVLARYDALHNWRKARAKTRGVESDVIVAREALWEIAVNNPAAEADLEAVVEMGPWRRAAYASELLGVVQRANAAPQ